MDAAPTRLRINLAQREFEVTGSEAFVREYAGRIEALIERLVEAGPMPEPQRAALPTEPLLGREFEAAPSTLGEFGAFIQRLPSTATEVDTMLAAGLFVQSTTNDDTFSTAEANKRLLEQGFKLGNPSQCVRQSLVAKRLFQVSRGRFRISQHGRAHLRQLLGPIVSE